MRLNKKKAIITGAGTGIGRAIAERFCIEGAEVMVAEIETKGGEETVKQIIKSGGTAIFQETDTSNEDSVQSMIETTVSEFGGIDIVVNNAGTLVKNSFNKISKDELEYTFNLNFFVPFLKRQVTPPLPKEPPHPYFTSLSPM